MSIISSLPLLISSPTDSDSISLLTLLEEWQALVNKRFDITRHKAKIFMRRLNVLTTVNTSYHINFILLV